MKAVVIHEHGGVDQLRFEERPDPTPAADEVVVRVDAVALNHLDVWVRRGVPGAKFPLPLIPGCDVVGRIHAVGDVARGLDVGQPVVVAPGLSCGRCSVCLAGRDQLCRSYGILGETRDGGCAEFVAVPAVNAIPMPESDLTATDWAAVPLTFLTAWNMLVERAQIRAGEQVVIHAAGSGVSAAGIQIARLLGARVLATAGTAEKLERARALGAEEVVNYREDDFAKVTRAWTGKRGADVVFDHVGTDTFDASIRSLTKGGRYVFCGSTSGFEMKTDFRFVFFKNVSILGSTMGSKADVVRVIEHVAAGRLRPIVDSVLPLASVAEGHEKLESRNVFGKVVLTPGGAS